MKSYDRKDSHSIDSNVEDLVESKFGDFTKQNGFYFVSEPNQEILEEVKIKVKKSEVMLHFEEVSVEKAKEKNILSEVPDAMKAKNSILEQLTGRSVEDRKSDLRQNVLNEDLTEEGVDFTDSK